MAPPPTVSCSNPSPLSLRNNPMKRENQPFLVNLRQNSSLFDIRSGKMDDSIHPLSSTTVHKRTVYPANGITNPFILYPPAIYFPIETERNRRKFIPATLSTRERTQRFRRQQKKMIAEAVVSFHGRIRQMAMMKLPRFQSRLLTSRPRISHPPVYAVSVQRHIAVRHGVSRCPDG